MRTQQQWEERILPKLMKSFSPRLRQDIEKFPAKDLPEYGSYYIHGPTGSGKTTLAAHMYIAAQKKRYFESLSGEYIFIFVQQFFDALQMAMRYQGPDLKMVDEQGLPRDEFSIMAQFSTAEYLVLDDLGSIRFTDWSASLLQVLINNRYENLLTTVITSNFNLDELSNAIGDARASSRIERMCKLIELE